MPFQPGKSGNPGGRPAHQTKYLKALVRIVKQDDWKDIVKKAIEQAKRGDKSARQWLSDYCAGKPPQGVEMDVDGALEIIVKYADKPDPTKAT